MKHYADFGIDPAAEKQMFLVPKISIEEVVDKEIAVLDFIADVKTEHGEGRYILKVRHEDRECKFFTTASNLTEALSKIGRDGLPFLTTIRKKRDGKWTIYQFT